MAGEVAVGQQQYGGPQGGEQAAGELVLTESGGRVEGRVGDGVGAAPAFEERLKRLVAQALAGSGEGRTGGQALDETVRTPGPLT